MPQRGTVTPLFFKLPATPSSLLSISVRAPEREAERDGRGRGGQRAEGAGGGGDPDAGGGEGGNGGRLDNDERAAGARDGKARRRLR